MQREVLLREARQAALRAYAPYSHFRVGAALIVVTDTGPQIVTGVNVENASFGLSLCAERNALSTACTHYSTITQQERGGITVVQKPLITHLAVACIDAAPDTPPTSRTPCGACRQWFAELAPDAIYYIDGVERDLRLEDLLPLAFRLDTERDLGQG